MQMLTPLHTLFNFHVLSCTLKETTLCMIQNFAVIRNSNHADILNTFKELHVKLLFDLLANMWISQSIETPAVNNQSCTFIYYYAGL